jgi:HAD superfamily hydrolase (TIGR01549 family)
MAAPAFIFDLDGTLIDSVYQHVVAWRQAFQEAGLNVDSWRIHRRIGMSGGLLLQALEHECTRGVSADQLTRIEHRHNELFERSISTVLPLRGAVELLAHLKDKNIPFGIATSGSRPGINPLLQALGIDEDVVVVERKKVNHAKPEPDELLRCQQQLGVGTDACFVVGDAVWDLLAAGRARMFSIGLLCGGAGAETLFEAGAFRVFKDPAELLDSLYQLGI